MICSASRPALINPSCGNKEEKEASQMSMERVTKNSGKQDVYRRASERRRSSSSSSSSASGRSRRKKKY